MNRTSPVAHSVSDTLSYIRKLRQRPFRQASDCLWIEGIRQFIQAYDAGFTFETVVLSPILLKSDLAEMLTRRLGQRGVRRLRVTPEQFRHISTAERASGIGAIVRQRWTPLECIDPGLGLCWLIVEQLRSEGNLGTILRTAEATGVGGLICVGPDCDPFDPAVIRASMGGIFHLCLIRTNQAELGTWVRSRGVHLIGLSPDAESLWTEFPGVAPLGLVIGEERQGITEAMRSLCEIQVRLPMTGNADSLNVGVATGVMLYELVRRSQARNKELAAGNA